MRILGRDTVDDYMIGTKYEDWFFGEQEEDADKTSDTVSYERASAGLAIRLEEDWAYPYTDRGRQEAVAVYGVNENANGQIDKSTPDILWGVEKVFLSRHADVFTPADETLKLPVWIDMGAAGGESFGKTDYDKL